MKPRGWRSLRSGRRPARPALTIWRLAGRRSAPTSFRSTARRTECRASTDRCGSRPSEAVSRRSAWDASRAGNSCRRPVNSCPSEARTPRRSNPAPWSKLAQTASRGASRSSTPAYFSTRFRGWMSPSRHSQPTFTFGCGSPGAPTRLASIRPTSSSRRRCAAVSTPASRPPRAISMTARPIGSGRSQATSRTILTSAIIRPTAKGWPRDFSTLARRPTASFTCRTRNHP